MIEAASETHDVLNRLNKKKGSDLVQCAIAWGEANARVVLYTPDRAVLHAVEVSEAQPAALKKALLLCVETYGLKGNTGDILFEPSHYRLLYLDRPNVSDTELTEAARWMVKDLIDYPLTQVAIAVFPVPTRSPDAPKMMVVVMPLALILQGADLLKSVKLTPGVFSIAELSVQALLQYQTDPSVVKALLYADEHSARLLLTKETDIALVRDVGAGLKHLLESPAQAALEVQRSWTFFQNQCGLPAPERLYAMPGLSQHTAFIQQCAEAGLDVVPLAVPSGFSMISKSYGIGGLSLIGHMLSSREVAA